MMKRIALITLVLCLLAGFVIAAFSMAFRMKDNNSTSLGQSNTESIAALIDEANDDEFEEIEYNKATDTLEILEDGAIDGPEDYIADEDLTPSKDHDYPGYVAAADFSDSYDVDYERDGPEDYIIDDTLTPSKDENYSDSMPELDDNFVFAEGKP